MVSLGYKAGVSMAAVLLETIGGGVLPCHFQLRGHLLFLAPGLLPPNSKSAPSGQVPLMPPPPPQFYCVSFSTVKGSYGYTQPVLVCSGCCNETPQIGRGLFSVMSRGEWGEGAPPIRIRALITSSLPQDPTFNGITLGVRIRHMNVEQTQTFQSIPRPNRIIQDNVLN